VIFKMEKTQHSTFNIQRPTCRRAGAGNHWTLSVECWVLNVFFLLVPLTIFAQTPPNVPLNAQAQLQVPQPPVDVSSPVTATASFDPPTARVGEKIFYRVAVDATESSIRWPEKIAAPAELKFTANARGQIMEAQGDQFRPITVFLYELRAAAAGRFTIPNFSADAYGRPLEVPAASLEVAAENSPSQPPPRQLMLDASPTNVFLGQPFRVRVMLPSSSANEIEALREVQLNGDGFLTDKTAVRQSVAAVSYDGQIRPAFIFETTVTPIATGSLKLSAQGFTAGREFTGPITITGHVIIPGGPPKYDFLVSDAVGLNVRPLPTDGRLPGFTGSIGKFIADQPRLSTNRIRVGQPVDLKVAFHGEGDLTRFVPPEAPLVRDWQIVADDPPGSGFTLIPLTDEAQETPAIPFSAFDPASGKYVDLTIPSLPVTVTGESLPVEMPALGATGNASLPLKLSGLAPAPGKTAASLEPPQLRGWLVGAQLAPVVGLLALWQWDRRRRFLEAHPEIVRRRRARRALRREKRNLQKAAAASDATAFVRHAADAMKIACAPHFPAHPQALVCADVLAQLDPADQNGPPGETIRKMFAAADAQFAAAPQTQTDLLALRSDAETILQKLEDRL
jgi:hypothetical protein